MRGLLLAAVFAATLIGNCVDAQAAARVYLLRGFANVFSTGMDSLAYELNQRGYNATVHTYGEADYLAVEAARLSKSGTPIIIAGHSLGGDAAVQMARAMNPLGGKVALIVGFGPTYHEYAPSNVARVVNYFQTHSMVYGQIYKGPGFKGSLTNIDLDSSGDITHFNIDKIPRLHAQTIGYIAAVSGRNRVVQAAPRAAAPPPAAVPAVTSSAATPVPTEITR